MARNESNNGKPKSDKPAFGDYKFVQHHLTEREKDAFDTWWQTTSPDAFTYLDELVSSDHKFTATWSAEHDTYIASLTCNLKRSPNYCLILTGRNDTLWDAIGVVLYKHLVIFKGEDWDQPSSQKWG